MSSRIREAQLLRVLLLLLSVSSRNALLQGQPIIRNVVVVGGTHGNEYTGVWCVKALEAQRDLLKQKYPSLEISTAIGNPDAVKQNRRFIDTDLNREFSVDKLLRTDTEGNVESRRAAELHDLFGPKHEPAVDLLIDLHSTTANMGLTVIVGEGDALMTTAAAYALTKYYDPSNARILMHSQHDRRNRLNLSSMAQHGLTIEVGPVPQGVLRHDAVETTQAALHAILECMERRNQSVDDIEKDIANYFSSSHIPCFRSAHAVKEGELSGKIAWPSDPENPNFPAYMVHKERQDRESVAT
jgi:aspartoacylase